MLRKNFHVTQEQIDFLEGLEGLSIAENVRRAIDEYIERKKGHSSTSPSKKGGENGRFSNDEPSQ